MLLYLNDYIREAKKMLKNNKGQNTAEYAILIALVVGAAIAMQTYVKRGLQGGIKYGVDSLQKTGGRPQYEPYYLVSSYNTTQGNYTNTEETKSGGAVDRNFGTKTVTRSGYQQMNYSSGNNSQTGE